MCHNNRTGVLYVIDPSGTSELPTSCVNPNHLMLAVTDAAGADHGDLTGLLDNDHPQYVQRAAPVNGDLTNTYDVPLIGLSKVRTQHLRDFAVTGPKIADGAVTTTKFGPKAVWRGNIALGRSIAA